MQGSLVLVVLLAVLLISVSWDPSALLVVLVASFIADSNLLARLVVLLTSVSADCNLLALLVVLLASVSVYSNLLALLVVLVASINAAFNPLAALPLPQDVRLLRPSSRLASLQPYRLLSMKSRMD